MPFEVFKMCYDYENQRMFEFYGSYAPWIRWINENYVGDWTGKGKRDGLRSMTVTLDCKCGGRVALTATKMTQSKKKKTYLIKDRENIPFKMSRSRACTCCKFPKKC